MPFATTETLGAGAKLQYEDPATPGAFVDLPNALEIGPVGSQGEPVQVTPILETTHRYINGMETPADLQYTFNHIPGLAEYAAFLDLARAQPRQVINMRVEYTSGDRVQFANALLGTQMASPEASAQNKMVVQAKQSGAEVWTEIPAS